MRDELGAPRDEVELLLIGDDRVDLDPVGHPHEVAGEVEARCFGRSARRAVDMDPDLFTGSGVSSGDRSCASAAGLTTIAEMQVPAYGCANASFSHPQNRLSRASPPRAPQRPMVSPDVHNVKRLSTLSALASSDIFSTLLAVLALGRARPRRLAPSDYVRGAQNSDGGFGMTQSGGSSQLATGWALLGPRRRRPAPRPGRAGLRQARPAGSLTAIGDVERTVLVVRAAGPEPAASFGGRNLIADILRHRRRDGSFDGYVSYTSFAIFALRRSGVSARRARSAAPRAGSSATRTATAASTSAGAARAGSTTRPTPPQALAARPAGRGSALRRAAAFSRARGSHLRGLPARARGCAVNAQSTAYAIQGLVAAGPGLAVPGAARPTCARFREPNGLIRYLRTSRQTPVWVTAQALLALNRRTF